VRGKGRPISSVLAETLGRRPEARGPAAAAAFAEAVGHPLSREAQLRALTRDGRLLVVVRGPDWAEAVRALAPAIVERVNARLGPGTASALEVRVGPLDR
jgi:hypothetical protein